MASKQQTTRSVIASKVSSGEPEETLWKDLERNYSDVERIFRLHDRDGRAIGAIRVDFKSDNVPMTILNHGYILINGRRHPVRPFWPLVCRRCQNEGHRAWECPHTSLTEERLTEIFNEQKAQVQATITEFESKWNSRLQSLVTPSTKTSNADQLLPLFKQLTMICQQFNQQNVQIQKQLGTLVTQFQEVQTNLDDEQTKKIWPQLPLQNGN